MKNKTGYFLAALLMIFILVGCQGKKSELKPEKFKETMEALTYEVESIEKDNVNIKSYQVATHPSHRIDYYVFSGDEQAKAFYNTNKNNFSSMKDIKVKEETDEKGQQSLKVITENYYMYISKIGTTVIYVSEHPALQESIEPVINYIGYGEDKK